MFCDNYTAATEGRDGTVMKRKEPVSSDKQIYEPIGGHLQSITISNLIIILVCQTAHSKFSFEPKFEPIKKR